LDESSDGGESTLVRLRERLAKEKDDGVICELERDVDGIHRRRMEKELKLGSMDSEFVDLQESLDRIEVTGGKDLKWIVYKRNREVKLI
jgi:hypothetical protein